MSYILCCFIRLFYYFLQRFLSHSLPSFTHFSYYFTPLPISLIQTSSQSPTLAIAYIPLFTLIHTHSLHLHIHASTLAIPHSLSHSQINPPTPNHSLTLLLYCIPSLWSCSQGHSYYFPILLFPPLSPPPSPPAAIVLIPRSPPQPARRHPLTLLRPRIRV